MKYPSKWRWAFLALAVITVAFTLLNYFGVLAQGASTQAASVGVIGAADGPTAVFVTSKTSPAVSLIPILLACAAGFLLFTNKPRYSKICSVLCIFAIVLQLVLSISVFTVMSEVLVMGAPAILPMLGVFITPELLLSVALLIASVYQKKDKRQK